MFELVGEQLKESSETRRRDMRAGGSNGNQGEANQRTTTDTAHGETWWCCGVKGRRRAYDAILSSRKQRSLTWARVRGERGEVARVSWKDGKDASGRCIEDHGILSTEQEARRRTTRGGPLPLADPYPARTTLTLLLRAETASPARQHCRVHTSTPPVRVPAGDHFEIRGASSTSEPMLGNAGAAPAPSLQMLMAHRKPPPPYSAPGIRWGREARRESGTRTGWGGWMDGGGRTTWRSRSEEDLGWRSRWALPRCCIHPNVQEPVSTASTSHRKRRTGGVPRPARTRHQRHKDMKHHPRLDVFGSGSRAGADTCADARTAIDASYDRAWIIGVPPARQMSASVLHCWRRAKARGPKKSPGKTKSRSDSEELLGRARHSPTKKR
ncbi:hypothetical protein K438DRAFT_1771750 [Mycena galopus ATCC 62051]|nr:hypothetical protein K438DRAFT_1771750 [Mycena galopus ATCC 62051]